MSTIRNILGLDTEKDIVDKPGPEEIVVTKEDHSKLSALFFTAALIIILAGVKASTVIIVPFLLATFIAILSSPLIGKMTSRKVPRPLAVGVIILTLLGLLTGISVVVTTSINSLTASLPKYQSKLMSHVTYITDTLKAQNIIISQEQIQQMLDPGAIIDVSSSILSATAEAASHLVLILLVAAFMMLEGPKLHAKLERLLERMLDTLNDDPLEHATQQIQRYLVVKTGTSAVTGIIAGIYVGIWGLELAVFWGFLAFVLNYIPTIGSILAALPPIALAWVLLGTGPAFGIWLGYLIINMIIGNIIEPRLMGRTLGLSPTIILLSLLFWGWMLGPFGALISAPLTMIIKIICDHIDRWNWFGDLLEP